VKFAIHVISISIFFISVSLIYVGVSGFYVSPGEGVISEVGEAMGRSLALMLIFYPIWKWGTLKFFSMQKKGNALLCYSILFLVCSGYQKGKMTTATGQLEKSKIAIGEIVSNSCNENLQLSRNEQYSDKDYGQMAPLLSLMKDVADFSIDETQRVNNAIQQANIEGMLATYERKSRLGNFITL